MQQNSLYRATVALAIVTIVIALLSQHIGGLVPCDLCYKQRWPYYIGIPLLLWAGFTIHARPLFLLVSLIFLGGTILAAYHTGVEYGWWAGPSACAGTGMPSNLGDLELALSQAVVRCDAPAFTLFGISMAGYNALVSVTLTLLSLRLSQLTLKDT